jgi:hypothetical protein
MSSNRFNQSGQYGSSLGNQHELSHIESYNEGQTYDNFAFVSVLSNECKNILTMKRTTQDGQTHTTTPTTVIKMSASALQPLVPTPEAMAAERLEAGEQPSPWTRQ